VFRPDGVTLVCGNCWGDKVAGMQTTAPLTGTYTVVVSTADSGNDATGNYLLTIARVPGSFQVDSGDHGGPITNNTDYVGRIEVGDLDMWSFTATQGANLTVTLAEIPVGPGVVDPGFWPWLRVLRPDGATLVCGNCWGDLTAQMQATAPLSGTYTVVVATADSGNDATGDYRLKVIGASTPVVPISTPDSYTTAFNTPLVVPPPGVMGNDTNVGGATVALMSGVSSGSLSLNSNGGFTYTPPNGFSGNTSFTYRATNGAGPGNVATVSIAVQAAPPTPTANNDAHTVVQDQTLSVAAPGVLGNDVENGGGALTAVLGTPPSHGGVTLNANGSFTYTPAAGYSGPDAFTYRAANGNGLSNVATVSISVALPVSATEPTALYAWSIVNNVVTLRWTAPTSGPAPSDYILDGGVAPGAPIVSIPTGRTEPIFVFGAPTGSFYVRIRAVAGGQVSQPSNEILIHVGMPVAPSAPAGLTGMVDGQAVALAWRNTFAGGSPQSVILDVTGTLSASLNLGSAESFVFNGVPGGTYNFSVRAANASGVSPSSNTVTLTFPQACTGAPQAPANFLAVKTGNILTAIWDPASSGNAPTQFMLHVSGTFNLSLPFTSHGLNVPPPPGTYTLSVSAVNSCGASAPTAPMTVTFP
jgi:Bacterial Ig domain